MAADVESKKVVSLRGAPVEAEPEVHQDVVNELERMLQLAKDGQLVGLVVGEVFLTGDISTSTVGSIDTHKGLAVTSVMHHRAILLEFEDDE